MSRESWPCLRPLITLCCILYSGSVKNCKNRYTYMEPSTTLRKVPKGVKADVVLSRIRSSFSGFPGSSFDLGIWGFGACGLYCNDLGCIAVRLEPHLILSCNFKKTKTPPKNAPYGTLLRTTDEPQHSTLTFHHLKISA